MAPPILDFDEAHNEVFGNNSCREDSLTGTFATLAAGLSNTGAFSRRCFIPLICANQTPAGFCQGDTE